MASEIFGLSYGLDNAVVAKKMLEEILGKSIPLDVYIDSNTLFNLISKYVNTKE